MVTLAVQTVGVIVILLSCNVLILHLYIPERISNWQNQSLSGRLHRMTLSSHRFFISDDIIGDVAIFIAYIVVKTSGKKTCLLYFPT